MWCHCTSFAFENLSTMATASSKKRKDGDRNRSFHDQWTLEYILSILKQDKPVFDLRKFCGPPKFWNTDYCPMVRSIWYLCAKSFWKVVYHPHKNCYWNTGTKLALVQSLGEPQNVKGAAKPAPCKTFLCHLSLRKKSTNLFFDKMISIFLEILELFSKEHIVMRNLISAPRATNGNQTTARTEEALVSWCKKKDMVKISIATTVK